MFVVAHHGASSCGAQVSLARVVAAMTKKVKFLQRDLEKEEAVFKTHAHRVVR